MAGHSVIGKRQPRLDGFQKVTGRSEFTDDVHLPGMLHGKIVRSSKNSAKICNVDVSRAEKLPGVRAVITSVDTKPIMVGPDQPVLREDMVNYFGDEIAAVAAVDEETAEEAAELIRVEYEPIDPILSVKDAIKEDARVIHDHLEDNYQDELKMDFGDCDKSFEESDLIRVDEYVIKPNHNCFSEHHAVVADFTRPDKLSVWTPMQAIALIQANMGHQFGLGVSDVRVLNLNTGGAFCGRASEKAHHFIAAVLSKKTGKPVKIRCTADEEFIVYRGGGDHHFKFKTGVKKDGTIKAVEAELRLDCGAYMDAQWVEMRFIGLTIQMLYKMESARYSGKLVYTNNPPYMFHHGTGMVATRFALGTQLDLIAEDLGLDPVEIRHKNAVEKGYYTPSRIHYASCGLKECIEKASEQADWKGKYKKLPPYKGIGIGCGLIRAAGKGMLFHDTSAAAINVKEDGKAALFIGLPDMGQGSHTAMAIIAAETLGIMAEDITVISGDTDVTPFDMGAIAQRGTFTTGNAVISACLDARKQIAKTAAAELECDESSLVFSNRNIFKEDNPETTVSFEDAVYGTLHSDEGRYVMGRGFYNPDTEIVFDEPFIGSPSPAYSFGAQIAEVEVSPETGAVKLLKMTVAHDVGCAINPLAIEGQMDGQVYSGMGQTLYEECVMEDGMVMNPSLLEYKLPRIYEIPDIEHIIVEATDPYGPYGAKEVGQGPIQCTTQAIANAVSNAIGCPIKELPITPEKVLRAIRQKEKGQQK